VFLRDRSVTILRFSVKSASQKLPGFDKRVKKCGPFEMNHPYLIARRVENRRHFLRYSRIDQERRAFLKFSSS
jgi:hypothetical protein